MLNPRKVKRSQDGSFVAYVYENDYNKIQKLVQHYPNIETGGDLFGLWKDERTVIIQQFIGPGKQCKRTKTSFHQDVEYLQQVGSLITSNEGLSNVGEWHSHHQIGMPKPSGADQRTVFGNMPHLGLERFVLFIATIDSKHPSGKRSHSDNVETEDIKIRPFLFLSPTQTVVQGEIKQVPGKNPHGLHSGVKDAIQGGEENPPARNKRLPTVSRNTYDKFSSEFAKDKNKSEKDGKKGKKDHIQKTTFRDNENKSPNTKPSKQEDGDSNQAPSNPSHVYAHPPSSPESITGVQGSGEKNGVVVGNMTATGLF